MPHLPGVSHPVIEMPDTPTVQRPYLFDASVANIETHRYLEPEVNRLKEWAIRANQELAEESAMNASVGTLPTGLAILLMVGTSSIIWGIVAVVALLIS